MHPLLALFYLASGALYGDDGMAAAMPPIAVFSRCYAQLTGKVLPRTHRLWARVAGGSLAPADACLQVLDSAALVPSGSAEGKLVAEALPAASEVIAEGRAVLQQMND